MGWGLHDWADVSDIVDHVVVSLAALIGGAWVLYRLNRERTDEAALNLTVSQESSPLGSNYLVGIRVKLENCGKTKIQAKTERTASGLAFEDLVEKLQHSCSLQVRQFVAAEAQIGRVDWFEAPPVQDVGGIPQINLLLEYEDPDNHGIVDFWLEPGEVYHLEMPMVLPSGVYLGKVTFVGAGGDCNFWSRVFTFKAGP